MEDKESSTFSPGGDLLAVSGSDGRLRIWDTGKGSLKQEFVPSAHLSATCTCVEWAPSGSSNVSSPDKRKKKKRTFQGDLLALGTGDGSLLFYSVGKSEVLAHTKKVHSAPVTGLSWSPYSLLLYSSGEDGFLVEWDVENATHLSRWKGGNKGPLTALSVFKDNTLLSAGRGITLWNLESKTSLMKFMGQPSTISRIQPVPNTDYFVTMSVREMHLQIWSKGVDSAVATLMLNENPKDFYVVSNSSSKSNNVSVTVVTDRGTLYTFQHKLNGPLRKPLSPTCVLKIMDTNSPSSSEQVPILASFLSSNEGGGGDEGDAKLAYGTWLRLKFETMPMTYLKDKVTIKREYSLKKGTTKGRNSTKKGGGEDQSHPHAEIPSDAKHLQPGSEAEMRSDKGKKRKKGEEAKDKEEGGSEELPMEERLSNLTIDAPTSSGGQIPDGSNLAHLLSQGLHSTDTKILTSVLSRWDQEVIDNTVRTLPVQMLVPLLNEIKKMLGNKPTMNFSIVKWLKAVFKIHSAFLMSFPSSDELLGPFMSLLHSKEAVFPQMCQLQGKLALVKGNIESKQHKAEVPNEALLVYHDESSDEGEDEDIIPSESEEFIGSDDLVEDDSSEDSHSDEEMGEESDDDDESGEEEEVGKKGVAKVNGINKNHEDEVDDESMSE